jgi:hypothetical protein
MFLVVSQLIVLLAGSGSINQWPDPLSVNKQPVTLDDLNKVKVNLNEVRKSLNDINSNSQPEDDQIETIKVESHPAKDPSVPVVVKQDKGKLKPDHKIIDSKKVVLIKKEANVDKQQSVSSDDKKNQSIEISADEVIAADIKPVYIKFDIHGKSLDDNSEQWACVYDAQSGLMWEVKSKDDTMRNPDNLYSWFNPDTKSLKGVTDGGRCIGDTDCDTNAYVNAMNKRNYCGHNDWHLPSREEMQTLVDYKNTNEMVKINKQYFPQTMPSWYWTSSDVKNKDDFAWYVLFRNGFALSDLKERPKHIRLVRNNI